MEGGDVSYQGFIGNHPGQGGNEGASRVGELCFEGNWPD